MKQASKIIQLLQEFDDMQRAKRCHLCRKADISALSGSIQFHKVCPHTEIIFSVHDRSFGLIGIWNNTPSRDLMQDVFGVMQEIVEKTGKGKWYGKGYVYLDDAGGYGKKWQAMARPFGLRVEIIQS